MKSRPSALPHLEPGFHAWRKWVRTPARALHDREPSAGRCARRWASVAPAVREAAAHGELQASREWGNGVSARAAAARVFGSGNAA